MNGHGYQLAELCAEDQASLYQNISTTPGAVLTWGLSHRARKPRTGGSGIDTMALFIGEKQKTDLTKKNKGVNKYTDDVNNPDNLISKNDIFMWMAELIKKETASEGGVNSWNKVGMAEYTVYSKKDVNAEEINLNNYTEYFSLTPTNEINKKWKCWIITDDQYNWGDYTASYSVENGQTETTFAFTALTGTIYRGDGKSINEGNLIDNITFTASYPLTVGTTSAGTGRVVIDDEINNIHVSDNVNENSSHHANYLDGTEVTITATPDEAEGENTSNFIGAYIDGTMYQANKFDYDEEAKTYTLHETIDRPKIVWLMFSKASTVTYDPNGGTYLNKMNNSEFVLNARSDGSTSDEGTIYNNIYGAEPLPEHKNDTKFIGWYFARGSNGAGVLIAPGHYVEYIRQGEGGIAVSDTDKLNVVYHEVDEDGETINPEGSSRHTYVDATSGVTLMAKYKYLQKAVVVVKNTTDIYYHEPTLNDNTSYGGVGVDISKVVRTADEPAGVSETELKRTDEGWGFKSDEMATMQMTPDASGAYMFMGWYDQPNGGERLSEASIYSYSISGPRTVYARFSKKYQFPYLSFVARDNAEAVKMVGTPFELGSHVRVGENVVSTYDSEDVLNGKTDISNGHYGGNKYGNTISTGFVANLSSDEASGLVTNYCTWVIEIPVKNNEGEYTYVKNSSSDDISGMKFEKNPILSDGVEDEFYNKGDIYKAISVNNDENGKITLKLYDKLPASVSGGMSITYGIIIDNLYAPGASATMTFTEDKTGAIDLTNSENGAVISASFEDYAANSPYKK